YCISFTKATLAANAVELDFRRTKCEPSSPATRLENSRLLSSSEIGGGLGPYRIPGIFPARRNRRACRLLSTSRASAWISIVSKRTYLLVYRYSDQVRQTKN